jgi:hypothetical protein
MSYKNHTLAYLPVNFFKTTVENYYAPTKLPQQKTFNQIPTSPLNTSISPGHPYLNVIGNMIPKDSNGNPNIDDLGQPIFENDNEYGNYIKSPTNPFSLNDNITLYFKATTDTTVNFTSRYFGPTGSSDSFYFKLFDMIEGKWSDTKYKNDDNGKGAWILQAGGDKRNDLTVLKFRTKYGSGGTTKTDWNIKAGTYKIEIYKREANARLYEFGIQNKGGVGDIGFTETISPTTPKTFNQTPTRLPPKTFNQYPTTTPHTYNQYPTTTPHTYNQYPTTTPHTFNQTPTRLPQQKTFNQIPTSRQQKTFNQIPTSRQQKTFNQIPTSRQQKTFNQIPTRLPPKTYPGTTRYIEEPGVTPDYHTHTIKHKHKIKHGQVNGTGRNLGKKIDN